MHICLVHIILPVYVCLDAGLSLWDELRVPSGKSSKDEEAAACDQRLEDNQRTSWEQREPIINVFVAGRKVEQNISSYIIWKGTT